MAFKKYTIVANVLMPLLLGVGILYVYQHLCRAAGEIGLGKGTSFYMARINDYPIHITSLDSANKIRKGWEARGSKPLTLWFGNSQLNGINQYKDGEKNCTAFIFDSLRQYNNELLGVSFPNGNLQEFLVSIIYLSNRLPVKNIVLPVFFDDLREDGIRTDISTRDVVKLISSDSGLHTYFNTIPSILALNSSASPNEKNAIAALNNTVQDHSEKFLDKQLENVWALWANRGNLRGNILNDVYRYRNFALGIKANTVRKMIPGRFNVNYNALKNIIRYCKEKDMRLFIYIPPLRSDVSPPYNIDAYHDFKIDVSRDCINGNAFFIDLEKLVPAKYWGQKGGTSLGSVEEIDFMHFQEPGHHLIADTIFTTLLNKGH